MKLPKDVCRPRVIDLLLKYGSHAYNCSRPRGRACDCGWDQLRQMLETEARKQKDND
jgi:hypothetical protein